MDIKPRIICLCGSTKFIETFAVKTWELELEGFIVLGCTLLPSWYCPVRDHFAENQGVEPQRDRHHFQKIDLADEILVLNVGGYIGESTRNEIEYAEKAGKPVKYLEPDSSHPVPGVSGEAQPLRGSLRERAIAMCLPITEHWRDEGSEPEDRRSIAELCIDLAIQFHEAESLSLAPPDVKVSRTFGELPEAVRAMIEPHAWDNMNISEQRDWALRQLVQSFADDEVVQNHTNQVLDAYENDLKALAPPESPGPRCPKCQSGSVKVIYSVRGNSGEYYECTYSGEPEEFFAAPSTPQPAAPLLNRETFLSPLTQLACAISQLSNDRFHEKLIISVADAEKLVNGYGFTFTAAPASPPSQETRP